MNEKMVKVRVIGDIKAIESLAELIATMSEQSQVLRVKSKSNVYPNRPPSTEGRIYIDLIWNP